MHSDAGPFVDLDQVRTVIAQADVFAVGFRASAERLLVDTRTSAGEGALIAVVPPAASAQERMRWLRRTRPHFGMPDHFVFFFWPQSIAYLQESGIWDAIAARVVTPNHPDAADAARNALARLYRLERDATRLAITGEGHHTLWQRTSSPRP